MLKIYYFPLAVVSLNYEAILIIPEREWWKRVSIPHIWFVTSKAQLNLRDAIDEKIYEWLWPFNEEYELIEIDQAGNWPQNLVEFTELMTSGAVEESQ